MDHSSLLAGLRSQRAATLAAFSFAGPEHLQDPLPWRGSPAPLQLRLTLLAEGDEARCLRLDALLRELGHPPSMAQRVLVGAGETRGRCLGLLLGLPEPIFEAEPAPGEWSVRRILGHAIATDKRYVLAVHHALERARRGGAGPLRPDEASLPPRSGEAESQGSMQDVLERLTATRDAVAVELAGTPDELLDAPTNWAAWDLDVRFRLHRFAAHDREHTIQLRKTLAALDWNQNEMQLILGDAMAARGSVEAMLLAVPGDALDWTPIGGGLSVAGIVAEAIAAERELTG